MDKSWMKFLFLGNVFSNLCISTNGQMKLKSETEAEIELHLFEIICFQLEITA